MAVRRMISKKVLQTESFFRLPSSAQALYVQLVLCADDAGVVDSVSAVCRMCNQRMTSVRALLDSDFILKVADDRYIITDWFRQNKIQPSRMQKSEYLSDLERFEVGPDDRYRIRQDDGKMSTNDRQDDGKMSSQYSVVECKDSGSVVECSANVGKKPTGNTSPEPRRLIFGTCQNVRLSLDEYDEVKNKFPQDYERLINRLSSYMAETGKAYNNHFATLIRWGQEDAEKQQKEQKQKKEVDSFEWLRNAELH